MQNCELKKHWAHLYATKDSTQVSWTQAIPQRSLDLIASAQIAKDCPIIDIGGGESRLVDMLLDEGYEDITVLDISSVALDRVRHRLGASADKVQWIESDIVDFVPTRPYALWHDRATFHFQITEDRIRAYVDLILQYVTNHVIISAFSDNGPNQCSGLPIQQYTPESMSLTIGPDFELNQSFHEDHMTPFHTIQNFLYCHFTRRIQS